MSDALPVKKSQKGATNSGGMTEQVTEFKQFQAFQIRATACAEI